MTKQSIPTTRRTTNINSLEKKLKKICSIPKSSAPNYSEIQNKPSGEKKCYNYYYEDNKGIRWPWRHNNMNITKKTQCSKRPNSLQIINCDKLKHKKRLHTRYDKI